MFDKTAYDKEYRETHKEQRKEQRKEYRETHQEQIKEYYETHKEQIKAYRETHKEQHRLMCRINQRKNMTGIARGSEYKGITMPEAKLMDQLNNQYDYGLNWREGTNRLHSLMKYHKIK